MTANRIDYQLIEDETGLQAFYKAHQDSPWLGFDTEFVGERRFFTTLCLLQFSSPKGIFIIDPLKIKNLQPILALLQNSRIRIITHAGENDYRILFNQYDIAPKNVVDTQIAAAFAGYRYPISFRRLVEGELGIHLKKGYTVADWEKRPLAKKQIKYAAQDVQFLSEMWKSLQSKINDKGRMAWVLQECAILETTGMYDLDPDREVLTSNQMHRLNEQEQVFLLRFYRWRRAEAKTSNRSKEMVLSSKLMNMILRTIAGGMDALYKNRRIPAVVVDKYGKQWMKLFNEAPTDEELRVLRRVPGDQIENPKQDLLTQMLDLFIKYKCQKEEMAHDMVMPRPIMKKLKTEADYFDPILESGWRKKFLGSEMINWLKNRKNLDLRFRDDKIEMSLD